MLEPLEVDSDGVLMMVHVLAHLQAPGRMAPVVLCLGVVERLDSIYELPRRVVFLETGLPPVKELPLKWELFHVR